MVRTTAKRSELFRALSLALLASGVVVAGAAGAATAGPAAPAPQAAQDQTPSGTAAPESAQADQKTQTQTQTLDTVQVVGSVLQSLTFSTDAKRNATNITDTIFSQGIGKLPYVNIASSLNSIPGVQLTRDGNGDGLQVSIRGLGASFTKVTLNGSPVDTSSLGLAQQNQDREVTLDLFPSQFFSQLEVQKSPEASMVEGGVTGNVNLRTLRPFDQPGTHLTYDLGANITDADGTNSRPQGSLIGSWTNQAGTFGVLAGIASNRTKQKFSGWDSIGWTTPGLTYTQCGMTPPAGTAANIGVPPQAACNSAGGGNWRIPDTVPATAGAGLVPGQVIDSSFLLAHNPGLNIQQISNALIPRLGGPNSFSQDKRLNSGMLSFEWRPNQNIDTWVSMLYSQNKETLQTYDVDVVGRNGNMIPLDMKLDGNGVVTSGTFTNAQAFIQVQPYFSKTQFWSIDPGADIHFSDDWLLQVRGYYSRSWIARQRPSMLFNTPFTTLTYSNDGGLPTFTLPSGLSLNDPNLGWTWNRVNIQNQKRNTGNKGFSSDLRFGSDDNNVMAGFAYGQEKDNIQAFDNSAAWQQLVCSGAGDICNGGPGALIPTSSIASFLTPGADGFINANVNSILAATNYNALSASAPLSNSDLQGVSTGSYRDIDWGFYLETNLTSEIAGRTIHLNAGVRYAKTSEVIDGLIANGTLQEQLPTGQTVNIANYRQSQFTDRYDNILPSLNAAWDVAPNVVLRLAASRTMSRPNPSNMLPDTNFSDPSAENATSGNPDLKPYKSSNLDLAGEWYTGGMGYVALDLFTKHITGFTVNGIRTVPFTSLDIPYDSLLAVQQLALNQRGGPNVATVNVQTQVNSPNALTILGQEVDWVQPLNWVTQGLGFSASFTHVHQMSAQGSGLQAVATGIAPVMWKGSAFYERGPVSVHLIFDKTAGGVASGANQNGIPSARLLFAAHREWDLSSGYTFANLPTKPQIDLDILNITKSKISTYFAGSDALYSQFSPGRTIMVSLRGSL